MRILMPSLYGKHDTRETLFLGCQRLFYDLFSDWIGADPPRQRQPTQEVPKDVRLREKPESHP